MKEPPFGAALFRCAETDRSRRRSVARMAPGRLGGEPERLGAQGEPRASGRTPAGFGPRPGAVRAAILRRLYPDSAQREKRPLRFFLSAAVPTAASCGATRSTRSRTARLMAASGLRATNGVPRVTDSLTILTSYGSCADTGWRRFCSIDSRLKSECPSDWLTMSRIELESMLSDSSTFSASLASFMAGGGG